MLLWMWGCSYLFELMWTHYFNPWVELSHAWCPTLSLDFSVLWLKKSSETLFFKSSEICKRKIQKIWPRIGVWGNHCISGCLWLVFLLYPIQSHILLIPLNRWQTDSGQSCLLIQTSKLNITLSSSLNKQNTKPVFFHDFDISHNHSV